jgi:alanyl-tRNA synthetase
MRTVEHVLNQSMIRLFGTKRSFSSYLNAKKSKCDYRFDRDLTDAEGALLQETINGVLARNLPVSEWSVPRSEAEKLVDLSKLPDSVGPDTPIRLVTVRDYDLCACIGEHCANTGEVGSFRLVSHEFTPEKGVLRVRFVLE